jgi:2-C-methyl-D-erythritol 4-phosphate cytidylyltransferase
MARYCAIVPAAGSGARLAGGPAAAAAIPKQYLAIAGRPMLYHALRVLTDDRRIERVVVVLAPDDSHWQRHDWSALGAKIEVVRRGGATRAGSVAAGLAALETFLGDDDWVLVHDAARPCLSAGDLDGLLTTLVDDPVGGLLAVPLADTLKRADGDRRVEATPSRDGLWQAQTPQMFRAAILQAALGAAGDPAAAAVTDESSAVEALGLRPRLVAAREPNFKVTYAADLALARQVLDSRHRPQEAVHG